MIWGIINRRKWLAGGLVLMVGWLGACQGPLLRSKATSHYAAISPEQVNYNLTAEQKQRMFVPLAEVPLEAWGSIPLGSAGDAPADQEVAGRDPNRVAATKCYLQARWLLIENRPAQAVESARAGLALDPNNVALNEILAESCYAAKKTVAADEVAQKSLQATEPELKIYQLLGESKLSRRDFQQAAAIFHQGLKSPRASRNHPLTPLLKVQMGTCLMELGYLRAANEVYRQAVDSLQFQAFYSQSNEAVERLCRQPYMLMAAMATMEVQMGQMACAWEVIRQADEMLEPGRSILKPFLLSLCDPKTVPLAIRYQRVGIFCSYLLESENEGHREGNQVLELFFQACQRLGKADAYLPQVALWADPNGSIPPLLSPQEQAYGLMLASSNEAAERMLQKELLRSYDNASLHLDLAQLYHKEKRWGAMVAHLGVYLKLEPSARGNVAELLRSVDGPVADLEKQTSEVLAQTQGTLTEEHYYLLAERACLQEDISAAEAYCRKALASQPRFTVAEERLTDILLQQQRYQEVLNDIQKNHSDTIREPAWLGYAGRAAQGLGQLDHASSYYRQWVQLQPENVKARMALGEVLVLSGRFTDAEQILLEVLNRHPAGREIYTRLVLLYAHWSVSEKADRNVLIAAHRRAMDMFYMWNTRLRADTPAQEWTQPWADLITPLESLHAGFPQNRTVMILLARSYLNRGEVKRAAEIIAPLETREHEDQDLLRLAAEIYAKTGDHEKAARQLYSLWKANPTDYSLLGEAVDVLRRADQAQQALEIVFAAYQQNLLQNRHALEALSSKLVLLFAITRDYEKAAVFFAPWYDFVQSELKPLMADNAAVKKLVFTVATDYLWALTEAQSYDQAAEVAQAILRQFPTEHNGGILYLVRTLRIRGLLPQAEALSESLVELAPEEASLRYEQCMVWLAQGHSDRAAHMIGQWQQDAPLDKQRLRVRLKVLRDADKIDEAITLLQQVNSDNQWDVDLVDVLIEAGRFQEAEQIVARYQVNANMTVEWFEAQISLDVAMEHCDTAKARINELKLTNPVSLAQMKARVMDLCGESGQAAEILAPLVAKNPADKETRVQYSLYLDHAGQSDKAVVELEETLKLNSDNPLVLNNLGYGLLERQLHVDRAGELLRAAYRLDPESAATLDSLGWFYYKKGEISAAWEYLSQAAAAMIQPDPEMLDHLGDVNYRLERAGDARRFWRQAQRGLNRLRPLGVNDRSRLQAIEMKLQQLDDGQEVKVAPLLDE